MNFPIITAGGRERYLACLPPKSDFGGLPKFAATNQIIPRSSWTEIDYSPLAVPVLDQGNHGSCVGHGSTSAFWFAYLMQGGTVPLSGFSPTSLYALINGGWDRGAVVSDAMNALLQDGICTMAECPETMIYKRQIPASAATTRLRFKALATFNTDSFDAIGSALMMGYPVSFGITIRAGFNNVPSSGVIATGGRVLGGHCMCAYGLVKLSDGNWGIRVRNSWGTSWGIQGNCILQEGHFGDKDLDAFAISANIFDPQDPNKAPTAS